MKVLVVTNMYPTAATPSEGMFIRVQVGALERLGIDVDVLLIDRSTQGRLSYLSAIWKIRRASEAGGFDVVHCRYGGLLAAATVLAVRSERPVIVSFCGSDVLGERELGFPGSILAGMGVWASRFAAVRSTHNIVMSSNLERVLHRWTDPHRTTVIPDGVDVDLFRPADRTAARAVLGWPSDEKHILFGGRDTPVKRPELAREAVERLRARGTPATLHIPRSLPHDEMATWMNAADALLFTSAHEGSPNVVREALACDLPVVSVAVGDVVDQIGTVSGCEIAEADPTALTDAMERVLRSSTPIEGRVVALQASAAASAQHVVDVYGAALAAGRQGSDSTPSVVLIGERATELPTIDGVATQEMIVGRRREHVQMLREVWRHRRSITVVAVEVSSGRAAFRVAAAIARAKRVGLIVAAEGADVQSRLRSDPLARLLSIDLISRVVPRDQLRAGRGLSTTVLEGLGVRATQPPVNGIAPLAIGDLPDVVRIHQEAFPDSALTLMGPTIVERYYRWQLIGDHPDPIAVGTWLDGNLAGFLFGGVRRDAVSGFARRFLPAVVIAALRHPSGARELALPQVANVARLMRRRRPAAVESGGTTGTDVRAPAEPEPDPRPFGVLAVAVIGSALGSGAAEQLMDAAEDRARAIEARSMNLSVRPENHRAIRFYERLGWMRLDPENWSGRMRKDLT